jgi:hypothetical protein
VWYVSIVKIIEIHHFFLQNVKVNCEFGSKELYDRHVRVYGMTIYGSGLVTAFIELLQLLSDTSSVVAW